MSVKLENRKSCMLFMNSMKYCDNLYKKKAHTNLSYSDYAMKVLAILLGHAVPGGIYIVHFDHHFSYYTHFMKLRLFLHPVLNDHHAK